MSMGDVEPALMSAADELETAYPTAWENAEAFTPPADAAWMAVFFIPSTMVPSSIGDKGVDQWVGILQIDLNYPRGSGKAQLMDDTNTIHAQFKPGKKFKSGTQEVLVTGLSRSNGRFVDAYYRVSFSVTWLAHISR